jgi:hypothetical protein
MDYLLYFCFSILGSIGAMQLINLILLMFYLSS